MLLFAVLSILLSNSVTLRRDIAILFNRIAIISLIYCINITIGSFIYIKQSIGIHGGLLCITSITQVFQILIFLITIIILQLTSFCIFPREINIDPYKNINIFNIKTIKIKNTWQNLFNHTKENIIEYPLIILFIISGGVFLISTNDLITIFLSIELQSYGLYLLSTIYRNSELSTAGGLIYFLLGGFSSSLILLGISLLYINSGTTNMDNIYIITSITNIWDNNDWYKSSYLNISLFIFSVGFLFKISAAPFHFWSPERRHGKSSIVGSKQPNSGNPLELQVPSHIWKYIGGWSNYSCKVTSLKASEKNVGNRGSKSILCNNSIVKEQRVDGSWFIKWHLMDLRCTLMDFERNYQVKIPSNQIIQRRLYYTESKLNRSQLLPEPWFISGFTDAEGCFLVIIRKSPKNKLGWQLETNFTINLHIWDINLLKLIQVYFGGVGIIGKERNNCCDFTIGSLNHIITKVISHFDEYPLKTHKYSDYLLFKEVVMMMQRG